MSQQGYPSSGGSTGGSAGRGIVLVVVAVALGAFLLARAFDGADEGASVVTATSEVTGTDADDEPEDGQDGETDAENGDLVEDSPAESTTTSTTSAPVVTRPPGQVKVATINGTGERGRAGRTADALNAKGFVTAAKNSEKDRIATSVIYWRSGYGDDAKSVANALNASPDALERAPGTIMTLIKNPETPANLADFNIFVLIGTDGAIPDPNPPSG